MRLGADLLETPRLVLRELTPGDLDFVATVMAHPEVMRFYPHTFDRAQAGTWLEYQLERYRRDGPGFWLAAERETGGPVGQVGLPIQEVEGVREPEVAYTLHRPFWGRGYATEAAIAVRDAAFDRWRFDRVISLIQPANRTSRRVAERVGMRPGRRVQFHELEHIVYGMEAADVEAG